MKAAIEQLIPHRAPMRWIDALTECTDTTAAATAVFGAGHFAVENGAVLETALVECVAQTAAAALGWRAQAGGKTGAPSNGMLIAVTNFRVESRPASGKMVCIEISERKRLGPMLMISGTITCEGKLVASGDLTLYA
jgi:predicted hotdog family 3-hydroxylacyl-ACP dehydratase